MKVFGKFIGAVAAATVAVAMVSCSKAPSQSETREKMLSLGYSVEQTDENYLETIEELGGDPSSVSVEGQMWAGIDDESQFIFLVWFETKEDAKYFLTLFEPVAGYYEEKYGVEGEVFYWGSAQAVEDFLS